MPAFPTSTTVLDSILFRDAFGTPEELEAATRAIPGSVTHAWVEGGSHGLRGADARVAEVVRRFISAARP